MAVSLGPDGLTLDGVTIFDEATAALIQVNSDLSGSGTTINSASFSDIGLSRSITPTSTSSKILVILSGSLQQDDGNGAQARVRVLRDSTSVIEHYVCHDPDNGPFGVGYCLVELDAPNTTGQITYKAQARTTNSSSDFRPNQGSGDRLIVMEIAQ